MIINLKEIYLSRKKIILFLLLVFALFGIILLSVKLFSLKARVDSLEFENSNQKINRDVVSFLKLFIEKILQGEEDVSFEDRLKLENAVRDLKDKKVLSLWESFTQAKNSEEAQMFLKNLLQALVNKIVY
jgi:uncharacterized SAM-binding protein YcdF (DUF218 family)